MKLSSVLSALALASTAAAVPSFARRGDEADEDEVAKLTNSIKAKVFDELDERENALTKRGEKATCTARNVVFRRE